MYINGRKSINFIVLDREKQMTIPDNEIVLERQMAILNGSGAITSMENTQHIHTISTPEDRVPKDEDE